MQQNWNKMQQKKIEECMNELERLLTDGETEKNEKHIDSTQTDRQTDRQEWLTQICHKDKFEGR